ncbi:MAG: hypothetical protein A2390_01110 [Candidatus Liptonbacteria bacterium RIFOXYB1_FULL_36_10]|uniref:Uncharacterized protein n=2 Tax=Candidatus Liptoniibacteriota TaxID=1817909 RepID=A0A1G2CN30_9BACT|nr:MAG: hypothetical protein A2390_01110 [Candidatus Liptonbacteria bacterium RIFOXYB1_FULL_36_10]OGZ04309.1 MAG: hypothetical protein A2604_00905 [Candidatus Liptonbacteria bacterium RIFOXYD1_FULL_36_11]
MTLTSHAVVGASLASIFPEHPLPAFFVGFASHFLVDAIPHGHYHLSSLKEDKKNPLNTDMIFNGGFFLDLLKITFDFFLGIFLSLFLFSFTGGVSFISIFLGALGAIFPDPLQFLYWKIRKEPLISLERFHLWIHTKITFDDFPFITWPIEISAVFFSIFLFKIISFF